MNQHRAIREQHLEQNLLRRAPTERLGNSRPAINGPSQWVDINDGGVQHRIHGELLSVHGDTELPVAGAHIEIHAVKPLKWVVRTLPGTVLAHCRMLLLETPQPIDLYRNTGHIADAPLVNFDDVQLLRDMPGYQDLATAAKSQSDDFFRHLLGSNPEIVRPLLCYYHPASFSTVRMTETMTDSTGLFQCAILESTNADDAPGYLFVARQQISSNLYITLYKPTPTTWHTHWNWSMGDTITLRTRHPLVQKVPTQH